MQRIETTWRGNIGSNRHFPIEVINRGFFEVAHAFGNADGYVCNFARRVTAPFEHIGVGVPPAFIRTFDT